MIEVVDILILIIACLNYVSVCCNPNNSVLKLCHLNYHFVFCCCFFGYMHFQAFPRGLLIMNMHDHIFVLKFVQLFIDVTGWGTPRVRVFFSTWYLRFLVSIRLDAVVFLSTTSSLTSSSFLFVSLLHL